MRRREAEAMQHKNQRFADAIDDSTVRQREVVESGDDDPAYLAYGELTAAAAAKSATHSGATSTGAVGDGVRGATGGSTEAAELELHRSDGTPLDFSSRDAKQESLRQQAIERAYAAEQASWGLLPTCATGHAAPPSDSAQLPGRKPPHHLAPRGRGRQAVQPAWLTRMEQGSS